MARLSSLHVTAFRGIREEMLSFGGKSLFVLGENGTGKSSIIDALEFFLTGSVAHLEGTQGISTKRHAPHVLDDPTALRVGAEFQGFADFPVRTLKSHPEACTTLLAFIGLAGNTAFILRRKQLLDFILAQAAPKYAQLAALIGIAELDAIELAWKAAVDDCDSTVLQLESQRDTAQRLLESKLGELPSLAESTVLHALNKELVGLGQPELPAIREAEARKLKILQQLRPERRAAEISRLIDIKAKVEGARSNLVGLSAHHPLWDQIANLTRNATSLRELRYGEVLRQARVLVGDYAPNSCPVCEQEINAADLTRELDRRILATGELTLALRSAQTAQQGLRETLRAVRDTCQKLGDAISATEQLTGLRAKVAAAVPWCDDLSKRLEAHTTAMELGSLSAFADASPPREAIEGCDALLKWLDQELIQRTPTETDQQVLAAMNLLTHVREGMDAYTRTTQELGVRRHEREIVSHIFHQLVTTKRGEVQAIYSEIENDVQRFYDMLHPAEAHGAIHLEVVSSRRGSAEIKMAFASKEVADPRAYSSEGHLDSLGLCIFLAFVKRFNEGVPILALDDVVTSVDAGHRARLCKLLFTEFASYQLIITTHEELWFEQLLAHQRAYKFGPAIKLRIESWTLQDGPRFSVFKPRWELLAEKIAKSDKQGAASLGRKTLEWFLFELGVNLQAQPVLRRDGRYDTGSLLDPVLNRARKVVPDFERDYGLAVADFQSNIIVGNLITHNNTFADSASINDVDAFVKSTKALHDIFWCELCGSFVKYSRDLEITKCGCAGTGKQWHTPPK